MKTVEMKLLKGFSYADLLGHCQVTYTSRNDSGQKLVYCLQYQGERWTPKVKLMRCTQDGEPSHEVAFTQVARAVFERPKPECSTTIAVNEWINQYESEAPSWVQKQS